MDDQATEMTQSQDANIAAAEEQNGPEAQIVECPTCHNPRRKFLIVDDKCDSCRTKDQQAAIVAELGWPEVRARRGRLIQQSDWTQLADVDQAVRDKFTPLRIRLRDVTTKPDAITAWYELDAVEAELAK